MVELCFALEETIAFYSIKKQYNQLEIHHKLNSVVLQTKNNPDLKKKKKAIRANLCATTLAERRTCEIGKSHNLISLMIGLREEASGVIELSLN